MRKLSLLFATAALAAALALVFFGNRRGQERQRLSAVVAQPDGNATELWPRPNAPQGGTVRAPISSS